MKVFRFIFCICFISLTLSSVAEKGDAFWHLTRGHELFVSKPYVNQVEGMVDSVEFHYELFLKKADKYDGNYTLGLFLVSNFYKDINNYEKEEELLEEFVNKKLPKIYTVKLHVDNEPLNYFMDAVERLVYVKLETGDYYNALKFTDLMKGENLEEYLKHSARSLGLRRASLKSDVYSKQQRHDAAINVMMPYCLEVMDRNSLEFSQKLLDRLLIKYKLRKVQAEVEYAFRGLYQKDVDPRQYDDTKPFYITIFDTEVKVPIGDNYGYESAYDDCLYTLWSTDFYLIVNIK